MTSLRFNDKEAIRHLSFVMRRQPRSFVIVLNAKRYQEQPTLLPTKTSEKMTLIPP
ncbi:MAG: hypothetical protein Q4G70_06505 [Pseudomonadota bacterium]|nr:hypothetical protein [Pseudomonadota bacterium]